MDRSTKLGKGVRFERIRRITGYLVGTLDRVKHDTGAVKGGVDDGKT